MITSAIIQHYKSIERASLNFGPLNIIVGPNGVGKSNLIDAFHFLHDCVEEDIDTAITKRHGIDSIRQWSKFKPYHVGIELCFRTLDGSGRYSLTLASASGEYRILDEVGEWWGSDPFTANGPKMAHSRFARDKLGQVKITTDHENMKPPRDARIGSADLFITSLSGPLTVMNVLFNPLVKQLSSFVTYSIYPNTLREPQVVSRQDTLASDGSNLGTVLKKMTGANRSNKESIVDALKVIMPQISDIAVRSVGGYYVPTIKVKELSGEGHDYNMSQVSDGTLRVLGLLTAFYQPAAPAAIAIEEPEQMIHPGVLEVISDAAKAFSARKLNMLPQVFLTTHSPHLLDHFPPDSIVWVNQRDGISHSGIISDRQLGVIKRQLFSAGELLVAEGFFE